MSLNGEHTTWPVLPLDGAAANNGAPTGTLEASSLVVDAAPEASPSESIVRGATLEDVDALTAVELGAYSDVYGEVPTDETVHGIRAKYAERVELLGDWIRVLEDSERGVYGMIVACPTSKTREDFMRGDLDMTDNATIRDIFDPKGKSAYVVNLAILPHEPGQGSRFDLFADGIKLGIERGVQDTYFESRLPGFDRWIKSAYSEDDLAALAKSDIDVLADYYWRAKDKRGGEMVPKDPLLRMYANFGCQPLKLITDAWKPDRPSGGYGVLCEFSVPHGQEDTDTHAVDMAVASEVHDGIGSLVTMPVSEADRRLIESTLPVNVQLESAGFMRNALAWAKRHKAAVLVGASVVAASAYTYMNRGETLEAMAGLKGEEAGYLGAAYSASMGVYFAGAAMGIAGLGGKVRSFLKFGAQLKNAEQQEPTSEKLLRAGIWTNMAGGVGAAVIAAAAIAESKAWPVLPVAAADLYSTVALRSLFLSKLKRKS